MPVFKNDPFPGTDYTQYHTWKQVTMPGGQIFYEVPGNTGYVFDPVASNASGRKVFRPNPKLSIEKQKEEEAKLKKQQEQQEFLQSPVGQLMPVVAGTGGLIAAHEIMKPSASILKDLGNGTALMSDNTIQAIGGQAPAISGAATSSISNAAASGGIQSPGVIGASRVSGAAPAAEAGIGVTPYLGAAGAGLSAYGLYNAIDKGDTKSGALSGAGLGMGLGMAAPLAGFGPIGWGTLGLMALGGGAGGAALTKLFDHESTRELAKRHTGELLGSSDDPNYQSYVSGMREQYNAPPPDPSKPYHGGQYATWEEYKNAGLDPTDLTGVYGNIKTFGQEWANLSEPQRVAVTKGIIDAGLYKSKKGEVEISDAAKAKEIKDNVLKGFNVGATTQAQAAAASAMQPVRSKTLSPGIGLDGKPIVYSARR